MSDEHSEQDQEIGSSIQFDGEIERDHFLQILVHLANTSGIEISVTLTVSGFLISGMIISGKKYYEELSSIIAKNIEDEDITEGLQSIIEIPAEIYEEDDEDSRPIVITFIHLRDARFFGSDGSYIPAEGALWRGRISEVSGFVLGNLGVA